MMRKRSIAILMVVALVLCLVMAASAFAETKTLVLKIGDPYMTVNGTKQEIDAGRATKPVITQGRTIVPIRAVIENMGGTIAWDGTAQKVTIILGKRTINLTIGNLKAEIQDQGAEKATEALDVPAQIINGRTMVPLRFVTENLGATVAWDQSTQTVKIDFLEGASESAQIINAAAKYLATGKAPTINPSDVYDKVVIGNDTSYFLVSLQSPADYAMGHVKGAINIPYAQVAQKENLAKLPKDKKIVLICYTGHTASYTSMFLNQLGYEAYAMKFGMTGWNDTSAGMGAVKPYTKSAGYPTDTTPVEVQATNSIPVVSTGKAIANDIIIAAANAYLTKKSAPTVNASDIYDKVVMGTDTSYFLVSLQSAADYAKGHVKGAINIPYSQIANEENLKKLPKDKKIVLICYTGHTASYSSMLLNQLGYEAYVLKFGTMGWNDISAGMGAVKPYTKSEGYATVAGNDSTQMIAAANAYLSSGKSPVISAEDVYNKIVVGKDASYQIVEIRKAEDYAKGHVPGAINIPYGGFFKKDNLAKLDKTKKIVVVCYTGHTASQITVLLNELGYDAYAMKFGMMGWTTDMNVLAQTPFTKAAGYAVETTVNEAQATNSLPSVNTGKVSFEDIFLAQTEKYLTSGKAPTISGEEVYNKIVVGKDPGYFILSVRKAEDYAKGHVAGAVNIPYAQVAKEENLKKLPTDKKIVVICYTGHTASQVTMLLNQLGYDAYAMKFGMMGWTADMDVLAQKPFEKAAGYATTAGTNP